MAHATLLLTCLLQGAALHLSVANDDCPSQEAAGEVQAHHLFDLSDAGSQFFQRSKLAVRKGKEVGEMSLQAAAALTQEPKDVTKVKPLDCANEPRPLQSIKGDDGFVIAALDVTSGQYETRFTYPWDKVEGNYSDINACDVNPFDDIIYCVVRASGESYVARLDEKTIEFVAILPASVFSAASFAYTGEFFVSMSGAETIVVPPLHEVQGYEDREDKKLKSYKSLKAKKPAGFESISDSVVVQKEFKGGIGEEYMLVLYGPKLQIAAYEKGEVKKTWIKDVEPKRWDNIYGAGWNYAGQVLFSTNRGAGVYGIPLDDIDLEDENRSVILHNVGLSEATDFNDGMNCKNVSNPWGYAGVPKDTGGTFATSTVIPAAAAPELVPPADSTVSAGMPEEPAEASPAGEVAAAPAVAGDVAAAPAAPPAVAAPFPETKPPAPPGTGLFALLIFLLIPCVLCCLRHAQKNQSDFMATTYSPGRLRFTPPPSSERVVAAPMPPAEIRSGHSTAPAVLASSRFSANFSSEPARPASPVRPQSTPAVLTTAQPSRPYAVPATMMPSQPQVISSPPVTEVIISQAPQVSAFTMPSVVVATSGVPAADPTPPASVTTSRHVVSRGTTPVSRGTTPPDLGSSFGTVTMTSEVPIVEFAPTVDTRLGSMMQPVDVSFGTVTSEVPVSFGNTTYEAQDVFLGSPTIASAPSPVSRYYS